MKNPILHIFLLILKVLFNSALDIIYKYSKFSKTLLKKSFNLITGKKSSLILFFLCFILLLSKVGPVTKK